MSGGNAATAAGNYSADGNQKGQYFIVKAGKSGAIFYFTPSTRTPMWSSSSQAIN